MSSKEKLIDSKKKVNINDIPIKKAEKEKKTQKTKKANSSQITSHTSGSDDIWELTGEGIDGKRRKELLDSLYQYLEKQRDNSLGYQANQNFRYSNELSKFLDLHSNNIGDPYQTGNYTINSKKLEKAVLQYFAKLWNAPLHLESKEKHPEQSWGYVLSMGCTEGNLSGLWNGRDYLSGKMLIDDAKSLTHRKVLYCQATKSSHHKTNVENERHHTGNEFKPICFYSQDTHYSIIKAMRVLGIQTFFAEGSSNYLGQCPLVDTDYPEGFIQEVHSKHGWPLEVPSNDDGSINANCLLKLANFFIKKKYPCLFCFNLGTTFKGAYDDVGTLIKEIKKCYRTKEYNYSFKRKVQVEGDNGELIEDVRTWSWFHVDGALGAAYLPYLKMGNPNIELPDFDFSVGIHSISMSGHKWIGAPMPCGIYMTLEKYQLNPPDHPVYIGSLDTTFAGSRNGFSSIVLWSYLAKHSIQQLVNLSNELEELADYSFKKLKELESYLKQKEKRDIWVERSPYSLTIRFARVNPQIVEKYTLSCEDDYFLSEEGNVEVKMVSHIFIMEHVYKTPECPSGRNEQGNLNTKLIDQFLTELKEPGAFIDKNPHPFKGNGSTPVHSKSSKVTCHVPYIGKGFK